MSEIDIAEQAEGFFEETKAVKANLEERLSDLDGAPRHEISINNLIRFYGQLQTDLDYYTSFLLEI